jgi:hypothetical protein
VWILLGVVLAAGYALSWRVRQRIWRARQVSGTRHPDGYWWEAERPAVVRFVGVTLLGAGLVLLATTHGARRDHVGWLVADGLFVLAVLVLAGRTRRPA